MMRVLSVILAVYVMGNLFGQTTFHDFKVQSIDGSTYDLASLKGKKVLVVNTASKCGLTPQYEKLEALYQQYRDRDFIVLGFPANNFLKQEPGSNEEIQQFCQINYGVSFPMMAKISVKGDDIHPLYQWLTNKVQNGVMDSKVSWNFQKYMIDEKGVLVGYKSPKTSPLDTEIRAWIEE